MTSRFDVYESDGRGIRLLLVVQSAYLDHLSTRVVVPLLRRPLVPPATRDLQPVFTLSGQEFVMATPLLAAVDRDRLKHPIANLAAERDAITRALDLLMLGF